ncbi:MAG: hypothetical protein ACI82F_002644 [Planctomycetota bacterium]|jgi:hypothetical protein
MAHLFVRSSLLLLCLCPLASAQGLVLHEFLASNDGGQPDEDGDDSDWIEIWNNSSGPVNFGGWRLTDDPLNPNKWVFPADTIAAGNYRVVFASDKDRRDPNGVLHTNFKLSSGGEYLALIDPAGTPVTEFAPSFPAQVSNQSYGFLDSGGPAGFLDPPTPGAPNGNLYAGLEAVVASPPRSVRQAPFDLTLSSASPGVSIYYSLDGTVPNASTGILYTGPIPVSETQVLRAVAQAPGFQATAPETFSHLFVQSVRNQDDAWAVSRGFPAEWIEDDGSDWTLMGTRPGASYQVSDSILSELDDIELAKLLRKLPTVSLVLPREDWFGDGSNGVHGIYNNSEDEGDEWERPGSVEWIHPGAGDRWQVDCGIAVQGGSSTNREQRNQLSLAMFFKHEYGPSKLEANVFGPGEAGKYDYLVLDAGNRHSINRRSNVAEKRHAQELRDRFMMDLHAAMGTEVIHGRAVHVYINGLYWGVYQLHERPDERWDAPYRGGDKDEYDWIKVGLVKGGNMSDPGGATPSIFHQAEEIALGGVAPGDTWNGQDAFDALAHRLNLERYADYLLLNYYGGNADWPGKNWMMTSHARNSAVLGDVHASPDLRPHSWDAEAVLYWGGNELKVADGFYDRTGVISATWSGSAVFFHTALRNNPEWPRIFGDRAHYHIFHPEGALYVEPGFDTPGTPFHMNRPERNRPAAIYNKRAEEIEDVVLLEFARWGDYWYSPGTIDPLDWWIERSRLLEDFFPVRSRVLLSQLRNAPVPLYPALDGPKAQPAPGDYPAGTQVLLSGPTATQIYYALEGRDPRAQGGAIQPFAQLYSGPVTINPQGFTWIKARSYSSGSWGAMVNAVYSTGVDLAINEVQLSNQSTLADASGEFEDWIELVNRSDQPLDLGGFSLTDQDSRQDPWIFPAGTVIGPGEYLVVFCDGNSSAAGLHADFELSASQGEKLVLRSPAEFGGRALQSIYLGPQGPDQSWARSPDSTGSFRQMDSPTPGSPNPVRRKDL